MLPIQDKNKPISTEEQVIYLYALNHGILDGLSQNQIRQFKEDILLFVNKRHPGFRPELRNTRQLSDTVKKKLEDCLQEYVKEKMK